MIDAVLLENGIRVLPPHRTVGIHQMLHIVMAAAFEDVPEAHQVRLYVSSRVLDRVTHSRLSREVNYLLRLVLSEAASTSARSSKFASIS